MNFSKKNHELQYGSLRAVSKTLKPFALALALFIGAFASATENPGKKEKEKKSLTIHKVVADYLSSPEIDLSGDQDAVIEFYINEHDRIVITDVETEDVLLERSIKSRLNFEKVNKNLAEENKAIRILLKFTDR
jgi:hypothetical protein